MGTCPDAPDACGGLLHLGGLCCCSTGTLWEAVVARPPPPGRMRPPLSPRPHGSALPTATPAAPPPPQIFLQRARHE